MAARRRICYFWEGSLDKVSHTSHPFLCYEFLPTTSTCEVMQGTRSKNSCLLVEAEAFRTEDAWGYGTTYVFLNAMVDWVSGSCNLLILLCWLSKGGKF